MKFNRRRFIQLSGAFAAATAMPLHAGILSKPHIQDIVLSTTLPTDAAFAIGTQATIYKASLTSTSSYSQLLTKLADAKNQRLFALLQPADAILLEQALRDSNRRAYISQSVQAPLTSSEYTWALNLGVQLAKGGKVAAINSHYGMPLVALTAYL